MLAGRKFSDVIALFLIFDRNIRVLCWTLFAVLTSIFTWYLVLPLYLKELGATDFSIGLAYTLFGISFNIFQIFGGRLTDIFGPRASIVVPSFLNGLVFLLMSFSSSAWEITCLMVLSNIFSALQWPAMLTMLAFSAGNTERGRVFGTLELFVGLGMAAGPALGWIILEKTGFPRLFLFTSIVHFIVAVFRHRYLLDVREPEGGQVSPSILSDVRNLLNMTGMKALAFLSVTYAVAINITYWGPFIQLAAEEIFGLGKREQNGLFFAGGMMAVFCTPLAGWWIDRKGARKVFFRSLLLHLLSVLFWLETDKGYVWFLLFILSGISFQASIVSFEALLAEQAISGRPGLLFGMMGTFQGLGAAIGPLAGGYLAKEFSIRWTFVLFAVAAFFALLTAYVYAVERPSAKGATVRQSA